jgi:hypothetical protein
MGLLLGGDLRCMGLLLGGDLRCMGLLLGGDLRCMGLLLGETGSLLGETGSLLGETGSLLGGDLRSAGGLPFASHLLVGADSPFQSGSPILEILLLPAHALQGRCEVHDLTLGG